MTRALACRATASTAGSSSAASVPSSFSSRPRAGFSDPTANYQDSALDLNTLLIRRPSASFYCRVSGDAMTGVGIFEGDYLIVDRTLRPSHGDVVVAALAGELTCRTLDLRQQRLLASNRGYPPIPIHEGVELAIEGVVTSSIRRHRCLPQ